MLREEHWLVLHTLIKVWFVCCIDRLAQGTGDLCYFSPILDEKKFLSRRLVNWNKINVFVPGAGTSPHFHNIRSRACRHPVISWAPALTRQSPAAASSRLRCRVWRELCPLRATIARDLSWLTKWLNFALLGGRATRVVCHRALTSAQSSWQHADG